MKDLFVLRTRKGVPGIGQKIARYFGAYEVTCNCRPMIRIKEDNVVFNYGRSTIPIWYEDVIKRGVKFLNHPEAVGNAVNKVQTLELLKEYGVPCLEFSTYPEDVRDSLVKHEHNIAWLARTSITGRQGNGIIPVYNGYKYGEEGDIFPEAPLYTEFYDKTHEFRVHVFDGQVIDIVQKKRMGEKKLRERGIKEVDTLLRSHKRGWVFAHKDLICDKTKSAREELEYLGTEAVEALGLDFGGVDVLAKFEDNRMVSAVVCEVNSAPGMSSPTTFNAYVKEISKYL